MLIQLYNQFGGCSKLAALNNVMSTTTADAADMKDTVKSKLQRWLLNTTND